MARKRIPLLYIKPLNDRGVIIVRQHTEDDPPFYDAFSYSDFDIGLLIEGSRNFHLGITLNCVFAYCQEGYQVLGRREDLEDAEVYIREAERGSKVPTVGTRKEDEKDRPIKARDVPVGALLTDSAESFFRFVRGNDAVKDRYLQK